LTVALTACLNRYFSLKQEDPKFHSLLFMPRGGYRDVSDKKTSPWIRIIILGLYTVLISFFLICGTLPWMYTCIAGSEDELMVKVTGWYSGGGTHSSCPHPKINDQFWDSFTPSVLCVYRDADRDKYPNGTVLRLKGKVSALGINVRQMQIVSEDLYNKAATLCINGVCSDTQKAIEYLNEAIRLQPDFTNAYNLRGIAYCYSKQYQSAIDDFDKVINLKPDSAVAYHNRGTAYAGLVQYQSAIEDFNKAISLKQDYADAYINRSVAYFSQGNNELGCRDAQKACELKSCEALNSAKKGMKCVSKGNNIKPTHASKILPAQSKDISTSIEECAKYARAMVDNSNKSEWKVYADKIKSICPGKGFECKTFYNHPEKNKCEPFILESQRTFFKDVKYGFPKNN
jgi:tetratricopeptide (TPR) repeat protein